MNKKDRYVALGWEIMEHKWRYYVGCGYPGVTPILDCEYDKLEEEYKALCKELGENVYSTECVGFPHDRPSAKLVDEKMRMHYKIKEKPWWDKT